MTRAQKDETASREDELFARYQEAYASNNFPDALDALQEILEFTKIKAFISSLIVDVYMQMGDMDKAYEAASAGVRYPNPSSKLYKQHAELIAARGSTIEELNEALSSIERAITLYNNEGASESIADQFSDEATFRFWFEDKTRTRTDMASLRSDIRALIYSLRIYEDVRHIESRLSREKQRTIELMALFTAIIALIFSNVQVLSQKREFWEIVTVNISLAVILTWILWLVEQIGSGKGLIPGSIFNFLGRFLGLSIVVLVAIGIIGLAIVGILYLYGWIGLIIGGML